MALRHDQHGTKLTSLSTVSRSPKYTMGSRNGRGAMNCTSISPGPCVYSYPSLFKPRSASTSSRQHFGSCERGEVCFLFVFLIISSAQTQRMCPVRAHILHSLIYQRRNAFLANQSEIFRIYQTAPGLVRESTVPHPPIAEVHHTHLVVGFATLRDHPVLVLPHTVSPVAM